MTTDFGDFEHEDSFDASDHESTKLRNLIQRMEQFDEHLAPHSKPIRESDPDALEQLYERTSDHLADRHLDQRDRHYLLLLLEDIDAALGGT